MNILNNPLVRFLKASSLPIFKAIFLIAYKEVLLKGDWRNEMRAAIAARDYDRILEFPNLHRSKPLLAQLPNVPLVSLSLDGPREDLGRQITFEKEKLNCGGASFDKVLCCMALHPLCPLRKLALLRELRRALRSGGALYVADFDVPLSTREKLALRGTRTLFGTSSADIHHQGR